ncbi:MAG: hypothetical protein NZ651_01500 [Candidatus Bipolaricaulota bacterium]|nr:hypothetical protein [Candidatus Bipolaricaulota bacterium]MDW8126438.1 hypothetical protein [Candidatus Bipolaricaulota bacterium]
MERYGVALREFVEDAFYAPATLTAGLVATLEPAEGPFSATPPSPSTPCYLGAGRAHPAVQRQRPGRLHHHGEQGVPGGFVLKAGAKVTLRAGQGAFDSPPTDLLWSQTRFILLDPQGQG